MGHVDCSGACTGLAVVVLCARFPRPPPTWPTITREVGTVFAVALPVGVNVSRVVRLLVRLCPVATVITTGDQPASAVAVAAGAFGFNLAQVAVEVTPTASVPQL